MYQDTRRKLKLFIFFIIMILIIGTLFLFAGFKAITGYSIFDKTSRSKELTKITGATTADFETSSEISKTFSKFKDIDMNTDIELQDYEIPIFNLNIEIIAEQFVIASPDVEITISLNEPMQLRDFTGKIIWENSKLELKGELAEYLTSYIKINWKKSGDLTLKLSKGSIKIEDINIENLESIASGTINLASKIILNLDKDKIYIKNYKGPLISNIHDNTNELILDGRVDEFKIETEKFKAQIN